MKTLIAITAALALAKAGLPEVAAVVAVSFAMFGYVAQLKGA